jgi:hypothetical protein
MASSAQARGEKPDESIAISVAHHAHPAPAQARGDQPDKSIAISLPSSIAPAAKHKRVPRKAFTRELLHGLVASGPAHSILAR